MVRKQGPALLQWIANHRGAPVSAEIVVERGIDQFDGVTRRIAHGRPWKTELVLDLVLHFALGVSQDDLISIVVKCASPGPQRAHAEFALHCGRVLRHNGITASWQRRSGREREVDPA